MELPPSSLLPKITGRTGSTDRELAGTGAVVALLIGISGGSGSIAVSSAQAGSASGSAGGVTEPPSQPCTTTAPWMTVRIARADMLHPLGIAELDLALGWVNVDID